MIGQNDFATRVQECTNRLAASGVDALGSLFDLTSQRLVRFALAITRNQHDAEDAVQTSLVHLAGNPHLLRHVTCSWAYLLRMVRNDALIIARRKARCAPANNLTDLAVLHQVDELEREESHRAVLSALRALPPQQAEVVVLKIWEGMTFAEIGRILELSPNTAASRYQYAMIKLNKHLSATHRKVHHD